MIPMMNIVAWGNVAPWAEMRQIEQDLMISRAIVDLFADPFLSQQLRFRGGTALNKLHFPSPLRYSEDIDLVRTMAGPIGPVLDAVRAAIEPWLGRAAFDQSPVAPRLRFRTAAEDGSAEIRLKIEINTWEIEAHDGTQAIPFRIENPWFSGGADIATFSREEMLATKLRALLQRDKGRDLFDLAHGVDVFHGLNPAHAVKLLRLYLERDKIQIARAEAERRMFAKLARPRFLTDVRPLVSAEAAARLSDESTKEAFVKVFSNFIVRMPGDAWARTDDMRQRFGI
jgi:predicted nucleotidyltransferase component of viral defense system